MDRYEFNLKSQQMRKLAADGRYDEAALIADEIDWSRVKNTRLLMLTADIYEATKQPEKEYDILDIAYERSPMGKQLAYRLALVASELEDYEEAENYYKDYVDMAPRDSRRYLLRYRLSKARGEDLNMLIGLLEHYLDGDMEERWSYELCELYAKAGYQDKCISLCDDLIAWFGDGKYVLSALKLKKKYAPLSVSQQQKYDALRKEAREARGDDETVGAEITRTRNEVLRNRTLPEKMQAVAEKRMQDDAEIGEKNNQQAKSTGQAAPENRQGSQPARKAKSRAKAKDGKRSAETGAARKKAGKNQDQTAVKDTETELVGTAAKGTEMNLCQTAAKGTEMNPGQIAAKGTETNPDQTAAKGTEMNPMTKDTGTRATARGNATETVAKSRKAGVSSRETASDPNSQKSKQDSSDVQVSEQAEKNPDRGMLPGQVDGDTRRYDGRAVQLAEARSRKPVGNADAADFREAVFLEKEDITVTADAGNAGEEMAEAAPDFDVDQIHIKTYSDRAYDTMNIQAELAKNMEAILRTDEARDGQKAARRTGSRGSGPAVRTYIPPATEVAEDDPFGYEQERKEPEKQITGQMSIEEILKDLQTRGILKEDTVESALRVTGALPLWRVQGNGEAQTRQATEASATAEEPAGETGADATSESAAGISEERVVKEMEEISLRDFVTGEIDLEIVQNEVDERRKEKDTHPMTAEDVPHKEEQEPESQSKTETVGYEEKPVDPETLYGDDQELTLETKTLETEEAELPGETVEIELEATGEKQPPEEGEKTAPGAAGETEQPEESAEAGIETAEETEQPEEGAEVEVETAEETEQPEEVAENGSETTEEAKKSEEGIKAGNGNEAAEEAEQPEEVELEAAEETEQLEEVEPQEEVGEAVPGTKKTKWLEENRENVSEEQAEVSDEEETERQEESETGAGEDESETESKNSGEVIELGGAADRRYDTGDFMSGLEMELSRLGQEGNPYTQMRNEDVKRETEKMDDVFAVIREMETDLSEEDRIYNAYTEEEPKEKLYLDETDRKEFEQYLKITGMESQIAKAINDYVTAYNNDGTSKNPNVLITGGAKTGKSQLAVSLIRAINRHLGRNGRKTARISGFNLNRKTLSASMPKLVGNDLLIEHAGEINRKIVLELMDILPKYTGGMIVVMEDEKARLDHLFEDYPLLADYFPNHLDIKEYDINEWAAVAKSYARSQGYTIDELGTLALYAEIDALYGMLQGLEVDDIKDIVDEAIEHSERKMGSAFAKIFGKKKETGRKVLHETDFDT